MSSILAEVMKRKTMMQKPAVVRPPFPSAVLHQAPLALTLNRTARGARFTSTRYGNNTGEIKWDNMDRQRDTIQSGSQHDMNTQSQNLDKNLKIDQEINRQNMNITNMAQNEFKNVTNSGTKQSSSSSAEPRLTTTQNEINEKNEEGGILHDVKEAGKKTAKVVLDAAKEATEYVTGNKGYDEPEYLMEKGMQGAQNLKQSGKETAEMLTGHKGVTNGPSSGSGGSHAGAGGRKEEGGGVGGGRGGDPGKQSDEMRGHERLGGERKQEPAAGMRMQGPQKMEGKIGGVEGEGNWGRPETHPNVPNDPNAQGTQGAKQEMEALRQKGSNMKEFDPQFAKKEPLQSYLKEKAKETPDDTREVFEYQKGQRELNEDQVKVADYLKEEVGHKPPTEQPSNWSHNQNWNEDRNKKRIEQGDK